MPEKAREKGICSCTSINRYFQAKPLIAMCRHPLGSLQQMDFLPGQHLIARRHRVKCFNVCQQDKECIKQSQLSGQMRQTKDF